MRCRPHRPVETHFGVRLSLRMHLEQKMMINVEVWPFVGHRNPKAFAVVDWNEKAKFWWGCCRQRRLPFFYRMPVRHHWVNFITSYWFVCNICMFFRNAKCLQHKLQLLCLRVYTTFKPHAAAYDSGLNPVYSLKKKSNEF